MANNKQNIQILLETMTRCGGNCSGCALSSTERMDTLFDFDHFLKQSEIVSNKLKTFNANDIEAVTVFLGQGDHFLMPEKDIESFVEQCSKIIPDDLKHKTVIFITASAIGKFEHIKHKMDLFYDYSIKYKIPFFIQTVFDPKKFQIKHFRNTYLQNILYFKEKCGMTEITINLGIDLVNYITPQEFHDWVKLHEFNHVELNWVINQFTTNMWVEAYKPMHKWLQEWLLIYREEPSYEINFLPFIARHFKYKEIPLLQMNRVIQNELNHNFYYDYNGNELLCQYGFISNLTPFGKRIAEVQLPSKNSNRLSKKILADLMKSERCLSCEFNSICSISASTATFEYWNGLKNECPWDMYSFFKFFKEEILEYIDIHKDKKFIVETIFDKNPIQNESLKLDEYSNNDVENITFEYFDECRINRSKND